MYRVFGTHHRVAITSYGIKKLCLFTIIAYPKIFFCYRQYIPPRKQITIDFSSMNESVHDVQPPLDISVMEDNNI